jgi:hypothetical protein
LIGAAFACELHYCLKYAKGKIDDELYQVLETLDLAKFVKNSVFIGMRATVHVDWQNKGVYARFTKEKSEYMIKHGFLS